MLIKKYIRLIENFVSLSIFKSIDAIVPLVLIPYLIIVVGEEKYGVYAFAYSLVFYLRNIVQYGLSLSGVRLVAVNKDNKKELDNIYSSVITTQIYLAILSILLLVVLVFSIDKFYEHYQVYIYFGIIVFSELLFPGWFFMGMEKMRFSTIVHVVSRLSFAAMVFLFVTEESDYVYISLYQSIGFLLSGIVAQYIVLRTFKINFRLATFREVKRILKDGFSSFLTLIAPTLYANSSIFLVGVFGLPKYVGYMEIGSKVSGAFSVLDTILTMVFYPFINRNKAVIKKAKYIFIGVGVVLSITMFLASKPLIELWLQRPSPEIATIVKILSLSPILASIISVYGVNGLMVHNKDKLYLKIVFSGSIFGLIVGLVLIPKYFYIGGAIAIVAARAITAILAYANKNKTKTPANEV